MSRIDDLVADSCPEGVRFKPLSELCTVFNGYAFKSDLFNSDGIGLPIIRIRDVNSGFSDTYFSGDFDERWIVQNGDILIGMDGDFRVNRWRHGRALLNQRVCRLQDFSSELLPAFIYYQIQDVLDRIHASVTGSTVKHLSSRMLGLSRIPVPPLEVQREIVRVLDQFTQLETELEAELQARRRQYEHYQQSLLAFTDDAADWKTLGDIGPVSMCKRVFKAETHPTGDIPFFKIGTFGREPDAYISRELYETYKARYSHPKPGDVLISAAGTIGRAITYDGAPAYFQDSNIVWIDNDETLVSNAYLRHWYRVIKWSTDGSTIRRLYNANIRRAAIAVPPRKEQDRIVATLDSLDALVNDSGVGLPAELAARRKQYEYYRDKLLTFEEAAA